MRVFRIIMLSSVLDIDSFLETQKIYYTATVKVEPINYGLGSMIISNIRDSITNKGVIVCIDDITTIREKAFYNRTSLTSITIPDSVTSIGKGAFGGCTSLKEVYCKPTTPPTLSSYVFDSNASDRLIYVPTASVDAYKSATNWSEYAASIVGYDFGDEGE